MGNDYNEKGYVREEELNIFLNQIEKNPYGKYLVYGSAGMGKTTFLRMIENELIGQGRKVKWTQRFIPIKGNRLYDENPYNTVYFIDGLDETYYQKHLIEEIIGQGSCCICTSREKRNNINFDFQMELQGLTMDEMLYLVRSRLGSYGVDEEKILKLITKDQKSSFVPAAIVAAINQILKEHGLTERFFQNIPQGIGQSYVHGKGIDLVTPETILPTHNKIIVPSKIRNDLQVINNKLLEDIAQRPSILHSLTSRQFEEVVCELFERHGYRVELTKQTHDGGKDIIILSDSLFNQMVIYAECKKYSRSRPVGVGLVRALYGAVEADRATAGLMVTSSYFSDAAYKYRWPIKNRMTLMDYTELIQLIQNVTNQQM